MGKVMKKMMVVLVVLAVVVVASALKSNADELSRVFEPFDVVMAAVPEGVELSMIPVSAGGDGDGYMVVSQGKEYFLPEGQMLVLDADQYYDLQICRVFKKENELLVMTASSKKIKVGHAIDPSNASPTSSKLFLAEMPEYKNVSPPSLVANMLYGTFTIVPSSVWDAVEVIYSDSVRTKTFWFVPKQLKINSVVPKNKQDTAVAVRTVMIGGQRMICTGIVGLYFRSSNFDAK